MSSSSVHANDTELPAALWLWLPLALLVFIAAAYLVLDLETFKLWFEGELGAIELLTPLLLLPAIGSGIMALRLRAHAPRPWLPGWMLVMTLGCFYLAGEEVSWGQHLIGWQTPEELKQINDQRETNIHNISSWFDQKPRLLLELFVLIGGIILPLWYKARGKSFNPQGDAVWFWPSRLCLPVAIITIVVYMPSRAADLMGQKEAIPIRLSEVQELFYSVFLLVYMASIMVRLRRLAGPRSETLRVVA